MSRENVELVRRIGAGWSRGDFSDVGWAHPQIVFRTPEALGAREVCGVEAMAREWADWLRSFEGFRSVPFEYFDAGDQVVTFNHFGGTGKGSGLPMSEIPGCARFRLRDGKVVELEIGTDRKQILRDAGLEP